MKIIGTYDPHGINTPNEAKKQNGQKDDFKKVMGEALNSKLPESSSVGTAMGPEMVSGLAPIGSSQLFSKVSELAISQIETILDLLDYYTGRLADDSVRTQDFSALADDMMVRISALDKFRSDNKLPERLDEMISDLVAVVGSEVEKFRRGDYS